MNAAWVDALSRAIATDSSRRHVVQRFAGALAWVVLGHPVPASAAGAPPAGPLSVTASGRPVLRQTSPSPRAGVYEFDDPLTEDAAQAFFCGFQRCDSGSLHFRLGLETTGRVSELQVTLQLERDTTTEGPSGVFQWTFASSRLSEAGWGPNRDPEGMPNTVESDVGLSLEAEGTRTSECAGLVCPENPTVPSTMGIALYVADEHTLALCPPDASSRAECLNSPLALLERGGDRPRGGIYEFIGTLPEAEARENYCGPLPCTSGQLTFRLELEETGRVRAVTAILQMESDITPGQGCDMDFYRFAWSSTELVAAGWGWDNDPEGMPETVDNETWLDLQMAGVWDWHYLPECDEAPYEYPGNLWVNVIFVDSRTMAICSDNDSLPQCRERPWALLTRLGSLE